MVSARRSVDCLGSMGSLSPTFSRVILKSGARTNLRFIRPGLSAEMCWLATVGSCIFFEFMFC